MYKKSVLNIQKKKFLLSEGNEWFKRNQTAYDNYDFKKDNLIKTISEIYKKKNLKNNTKILEIGCGDGSRLEYLAKNIKIKKIYGIDPSKMAVKKAISKGVLAKIGTADYLPFENKKFDMIIFGFCLYLVDDEDLFKVINEADRALNYNGYIIIFDFYSNKTKYYKYKHCKGIKSRHMNYKNLFISHPSYRLILEKKFIYERRKAINTKIAYTSISAISKKSEKKFK